MMTATLIDDPALFAMLASLADNKQFLGRRYAFWSSGAPALESAVAAAAMTQDEIGHARTLYPLLEAFTQGQSDPTQLDPMTRTLRWHVAVLDRDFRGWSDFVATNFLLDSALTTMVTAAQEARYEPLRARARKMVQEEQAHFVHGQGWVQRLARAGGAVRAALIAALNWQWEEVLCWFGPPDAPGMAHLLAEGIIDATPDDLRHRYLARVMPVLQAVEIPMLVAHDPATDRWRPRQALPWSRWQAEARRLG